MRIAPMLSKEQNSAMAIDAVAARNKNTRSKRMIRRVKRRVKRSLHGRNADDGSGGMSFISQDGEDDSASLQGMINEFGQTSPSTSKELNQSLSPETTLFRDSDSSLEAGAAKKTATTIGGSLGAHSRASSTYHTDGFAVANRRRRRGSIDENTLESTSRRSKFTDADSLSYTNFSSAFGDGASSVASQTTNGSLVDRMRRRRFNASGSSAAKRMKRKRRQRNRHVRFKKSPPDIDGRYGDDSYAGGGGGRRGRYYRERYYGGETASAGSSSYYAGGGGGILDSQTESLETASTNGTDTDFMDDVAEETKKICDGFETCAGAAILATTAGACCARYAKPFRSISGVRGLKTHSKRTTSSDSGSVSSRRSRLACLGPLLINDGEERDFLWIGNEEDWEQNDVEVTFDGAKDSIAVDGDAVTNVRSNYEEKKKKKNTKTYHLTRKVLRRRNIVQVFKGRSRYKVVGNEGHLNEMSLITSPKEKSPPVRRVMGEDKPLWCARKRRVSPYGCGQRQLVSPDTSEVGHRSSAKKNKAMHARAASSRPAPHENDTPNVDVVDEPKKQLQRDFHNPIIDEDELNEVVWGDLVQHSDGAPAASSTGQKGASSRGMARIFNRKKKKFRNTALDTNGDEVAYSYGPAKYEVVGRLPNAIILSKG